MRAEVRDATPKMSVLKFCAALAATLCLGLVSTSQACDLRTLPGGHALLKPGAAMQLAYATQPPKVESDKMFSVVIHLCSRQAIERITVDAHMPEHRHGMNYKPRMVQNPDGSYHATGFLFHMPGKWEFVFEVRADGEVERFSHAVMVE